MDISKLSAAELDDLIAKAAERRAGLRQPPPDKPVGQIQVIVNPNWYTEPNPEGSLLQILHPGFGWLNFILPAMERNRLLGFLLMQALVPTGAGDTKAASPGTVAPAAGGGGKVH